MRPSDTRMLNWKARTFVVGKHVVGDFAMCLWEEMNSPAVVQISLGDALYSNASIRVATTIYFAGGRPAVTVNYYDCGTPASPNSLDTRSVTHGAYRGYGEIYECLIPAGNLLSGLNNVSIAVASVHSGDEYLSPVFILDAIVPLTSQQTEPVFTSRFYHRLSIYWDLDITESFLKPGPVEAFPNSNLQLTVFLLSHLR
ncbi:galactose-binding like protein [Aspergillus homomorphus CBS 101889]|uniref:Galactose-binding like protein n=1 Tax=Aspergillus homomorphus (strain CBS 101889) TaxID=1450537 RepID=A0A395HXL0_ASPHC|nr:galactose-binding like protein [Aspergillus homomorphus CBS 101889]RAL12661.1 galactose-binding like protein [Aspergillus homomorphus CBS 101889]